MPREPRLQSHFYLKGMNLGASPCHLRASLVAQEVKKPLQCGFDPWVRKIPWRGKRQPTAVFLPREFRRQRSLAGYSTWGLKELDTIK